MQRFKERNGIHPASSSGERRGQEGTSFWGKTMRAPRSALQQRLRPQTAQPSPGLRALCLGVALCCRGACPNPSPETSRTPACCGPYFACSCRARPRSGAARWGRCARWNVLRRSPGPATRESGALASRCCHGLGEVGRYQVAYHPPAHESIYLILNCRRIFLMLNP